MLSRKEETVDETFIQMVAFKLEEEEFAVNIHQVKEVIKMPQVTPLPHAAHYIEGIINLRGEVIPVICLRKRFQLPVEDGREQARIIIIDINENSVGLIVDSVTEVLRVSSEAIQLPPSTRAGVRTDLIESVGKLDERLLIILDLTKILSSQEMVSLEEITLSDKGSSN